VRARSRRQHRRHRAPAGFVLFYSVNVDLFSNGVLLYWYTLEGGGAESLWPGAYVPPINHMAPAACLSATPATTCLSTGTAPAPRRGAPAPAQGVPREHQHPTVLRVVRTLPREHQCMIVVRCAIRLSTQNHDRAIRRAPDARTHYKRHRHAR
jgi:hypothetical protein